MYKKGDIIDGQENKIRKWDIIDEQANKIRK